MYTNTNGIVCVQILKASLFVKCPDFRGISMYTLVHTDIHGNT